MSRRVLVVVIGTLGCASTGTMIAASNWSAPARGPTTVPPDATRGVAAEQRAVRARADYDRGIGATFEALRASYGDLTYPGLVSRLALAPAPDSGPGFDPTRVAFYPMVRDALKLTSQHEQTYRRVGLVGIERHYETVADAYLDIYKLDLPVLVTTDSILHALHRSYEGLIKELEADHFLAAIADVLAKTHDSLAQARADLGDPALKASARDVDLYLTVARTLLDGDTRSLYGQHGAVKQVLAAIASLRVDKEFHIYGGSRPIDWSQFKPRGHYAESPKLEHYFQAMIWLGRPELGFSLDQVDPVFGERDVVRELRAASLLSRLMSNARQIEPLAAVDRALGFLVGLSDSAGPVAMCDALSQVALPTLRDLGPASSIATLSARLAADGVGRQRVRSQIGRRPEVSNGPEVALPATFQLFGQRFVVDSFVLSKVVFDAIHFGGEPQERFMPTGLDVMAALGNDEAVALLEPELRKHNYAANLLASRDVVEARPPDAWNASLYDVWLSALAKLDDVPPNTTFPRVMRSRAWQRKQLQTQLASWSELRHDTVLYAKQSQSMMVGCEYPTGYVEPYPAFYARIALFADETKRRLVEMKISTRHLVAFLDRFATNVRKLERMAQKELSGIAFDADEITFIKHTINVKGGGGCVGPPEIYNGWYPELIYGGKPTDSGATVADVHTDSNSGAVLEAGVGKFDLVVVAVDNQTNRAAYVGPIYAYYEFTSTTRLRDVDWEIQLGRGPAPPRPPWIRSFMPDEGMQLPRAGF